MQKNLISDEIIFLSARFFLSIYLVVYFFSHLSYSPLLFSAESNTANFFNHPLFFKENIFNFFHFNTEQTKHFFSVLIFSSVLIPFEKLSRIASIFTFLGLLQLTLRNPFHPELHLSFIGVLLILCAIRPKTDLEFTFAKRVLWIIAAFAYAASGFNKLKNPFWRNGDAIYWLWQSKGFFNSSIYLFIQKVSHFIHADFFAFFKILTFAALFLECAFPLLILTHKGRLIAFLGITLMHLTILVSSTIIPISSGMLLFHFFTLEKSWLYRACYPLRMKCTKI